MAVEIYYTTQGGKTNTIVIDATVTEGHSYESEITDNPVETGAAVTDHVRTKPRQIKLDCVLTDSPLPTASSPFPQAGLAVDTYTQIDVLRESGTLVSVRTTLRTYDNLMIQSLTAPRDKGTKNAVRFSIALREVRFVDTQVVPIKRAQVRKAQPTVDKGPKNKTVAPPAAVTKSKSLIIDSIDTISSFFKPGVK